MDMINVLSDDIICHILSFLPLSEATSTSVLSKRWRYLFAYRTNLHLDDQEVGGGQSFIDFVDRVLSASGNFHMRKISIKCLKSIDAGHVTRWMTDVLKHGVLHLDIDVSPNKRILVPLEMFTCKTLVELKLSEGFDALIPDDVSLPSLKTLCLTTVCCYNSDGCAFEKLLSACRVLEELFISGRSWQRRKCCSTVSSLTLKKLTILSTQLSDYWDLSLDTPSLAYVEYSDKVQKDCPYPYVHLPSLIEADIANSNPTNLIKGLRNVETLELSGAITCLIFHYFREAIPMLSKLSRLSITIDSVYYRWEYLPILLEKSPNLQTLVLKGPNYDRQYEQEFGHSCPVKVLMITEYGGKSGELELMEHLLEKLSCLELVKVRVYAINDEEKSRITKDLLMVPKPSSCKIQIKFCENTK
ncbi:PREDICTED: F-box protein At4g22280-like [Camelina sativa]|uniref:F-box protein At4g22280-like n=1 Tax=Camelina sativa TaxID=90675 RepID=A0ABM0V5K7_CAMSA|nr:PREDICTED: F-box protein At4g22280-like [Camelina sativa]